MSLQDKKQLDSAVTNASPRKTWSKPVIITASVRDHTEDGTSTGTDDGHGSNDFTLS